MDREQVVYTVGSLLAIYGAVYFVTALSSPAFFLRSMAIGLLNYRSYSYHPTGRDRLIGWVKGLVAFIGLGYLTYRAVAPLCDWIPFDWGGHDEDGEWQPARDTLRGLLTLFGTVWALTSAERLAKLQAK